MYGTNKNHRKYGTSPLSCLSFQMKKKKEKIAKL